MIISLELHLNLEIMNLYILVETNESWEEFVKFLQKIVIAEGNSFANDMGNHCTWNILGSELTAYDKPQFEYDEAIQGDDVSRYNFVLRIAMLGYDDSEEVDRMQMAMARFIFTRLRKYFEKNISLYKDLEFRIRID